MKYLALLFLLAAAATGWFWGRPTQWADGSDWVTGILALIGLVIIVISLRNTGKAFTDESGGH